MEPYEELRIPVSKLYLDSINPRHEFIESQVGIIDWLTSEHSKMGEKLLILAKDIARHGLNPSEKVMVIKDETRKETYIVIEGNRRIAAVKLLNNPDLASAKKWKDSFAKVRGQKYVPIKETVCTVYRARADANHFIELKHLVGEGGGTGVVPWDPIQKARHEEQMTGKTRNKNALDILNFIQQSPLFDDQTRRIAADTSFPLTTLQRVLTDTEFRESLGIGKNRAGELLILADPEEVAKPLKKVVRDFGSGKKNVRNVINKEERNKYLNEFGPDELPDHAKRLSEAKPLKDISTIPSSIRPDVLNSVMSTPKYQDPRNRDRIVMQGFRIGIDARTHNRARRVFEELRTLPLKDKSGKSQYPNAGIALVRTFIEVSIDSYIRARDLKHQDPKGWKEKHIRVKLEYVIKDLEDRKKLDYREVESLKKLLGGQEKLAHPDSINEMIHNLHELPNPNDIIEIWDKYSPFLQKLWDAI